MFSLDSFDRRSFHPISWAPADESHLTDDELREDYYGHGMPRRTIRGRLHRQDRQRPFQDASEADIERLVREKWEAIEAARAERVNPSKSDGSAAPVEPKRRAPAAQVSNTAQITSAAIVPTRPTIRSAAWQPLPEVPPITAAVDPEATEARRQRRQRDDEALVMLLAELV